MAPATKPPHDDEQVEVIAAASTGAADPTRERPEADAPAPGGPHDPASPDRLEPLRDVADGAGGAEATDRSDDRLAEHRATRSDDDQPLGSDPMVGEAPSG